MDEKTVASIQICWFCKSEKNPFEYHVTRENNPENFKVINWTYPNKSEWVHRECWLAERESLGWPECNCSNCDY